MQKRGISLVALVITIIVLIILTAGVIMLAGGENGIIARAQRAVEANNMATATEKVLLEVSNIKMELAGTDQTLSQYLYDETNGEARRTELARKEISVPVTLPVGNEIVFTVGDYSVTTDLNGNILSTEKNGEAGEVLQPQESNVMVVASSDGTGTALGAGTQATGTTTYISFEANLEGGTITSVTYNGTTPATTITAQGNKYVQSITSNGTYSFTINGTVGGSATSKTFTVTVNQYIYVLGDAVNASRYGDKINYGVSLAPTAGNAQTEGHLGDGWKIFYEDSEYLYIIAEDYLHTSRFSNGLEEATSMLICEDAPQYSLWWYYPYDYIQNAGATDINVGKAKKFGLSWLESYPTSTNDNIKMVADLFNDRWTEEFGNGIEGVTCEAIASPTIEMYVKSWNAKGYTSLYCNNSNEYGYYMGTTTTPTTFFLDISDDTGYDDTLYYPHQDEVSRCIGYWLASPSAPDFPEYMMFVRCDGRVRSISLCTSNLGVRPVVCIPKSDIQISSAGAGVWNVSKQ